MQCSFAILAMLLGTVPAVSAANSPQDDREVVVRVLRFSDEPAAYSFMVINNGTTPITHVVLGRGDDPVLEVSFDTVPVSIGSPSGWRGRDLVGHESVWLSYQWEPEDRKAWILPGQTLSGFSLQLPVPRGDVRDGEGRPVPLDLTDVPFSVLRYAGRTVVGTVELDRGPESRMRPTSEAEALP